MNALTKFFAAGGAEGKPGAAPLNGTSAPPARKLTAAEKDAAIEILARSHLVSDFREGEATALHERRVHLAEEIEQARTEAESLIATKERELRSAEVKTRKLEEQLREASGVSAAIRAEIDQIGRVAERAIAERERQLEASADPVIDLFRLEVEREQQITRNHSPGFLYARPHTDRDGNSVRTAGYDQRDQAHLVRRSEILRDVHRRLWQLKLLAIPHDQLLTMLDDLKAQIATVPIPPGCSKMEVDPRDNLVQPISNDSRT